MKEKGGFGTVRPVWVSDDVNNECKFCGTTFRVWPGFRRHHCRGCGKVRDINCTHTDNFYPLKFAWFNFNTIYCINSVGMINAF